MKDQYTSVQLHPKITLITIDIILTFLQIFTSSAHISFRSYRRVAKVDIDKCKARQSKCQKIKCSEEFDPVCGSDAHTYPNQCQLNLATCLKGIQLAHIGNCTSLKEQSCPKKCDNSTDEPICGSDGNAYEYNVLKIFSRYD